MHYFRGWLDYAAGFGDLEGNVWLGLDRIARLTSAGPVELHVYFEKFDGQWAYASYRSFQVASASDRYRLYVSGYAGTAGDSLAYHNEHQFSTFDHSVSGTCPVLYSGAWWYDSCHYSNLNGLYLGGSHSSYADGIDWYFFTGHHYSLKTTIMKIRPLF